MEKLSEPLDVVATVGVEESERKAEQEIQKLERARIYPMHLTQLVLDSNYCVEVRILASAKLKKNINAHWCSTAKGFVAPEINSKDKDTIKILLLQGLREPNTEVRKAVAETICTIVRYDSPENRARLVETLFGYLNEESEFTVHGGLLVLRNISVKEKDANLKHNCVIILREVSRIFSRDSQYSSETRCLACKILTDVSYTLVSQKQSGMIRLHLQPALSQFCGAVMRSWRSERSDIKLKATILNAFLTLLDEIPKCVFSFLPEIVPLVWESLIDCTNDYQANVVNAPESSGVPKHKRRLFLISPVKIDENPEDFFEMMLEFIMRTLTVRNWDLATIGGFRLTNREWSYLQNNFIMPHALRHLIILMEIPACQIKLWNTDVDDFLDFEEFKTHTDGNRRGTEQLILDLVQKKACAFADALIICIMKHLEAENVIRVKDQPRVDQNSWQSREALLLAFGALKGSIVLKKNGESPRYDVVPLLKNIGLADLNDPASHPFLVARCLCIGGLYADLMPLGVATAFLKATVNGLQESHPACVKLCAAKAVCSWYGSKKNKKMKNILKSNVPALFRGLSSLAEAHRSGNVFTFVLNSIASLMPFVKGFTASVAARIYWLTEKALLEYHEPHTYRKPWLPLLTKLMQNEYSVQVVQQRLVRKLMNVMNKSKDKSDRKCTKGSSTLSIVDVVVKCSPLPLSDLLIDSLFPACCNFITSTKDFWNLGYGIKVIGTYLSRSFKQVAYYRDKDGRYGAQYALRVITHDLKQKTTIQLPDLDGVYEMSKRLMNDEQTWPQVRIDVDEFFRALLFSLRDNKSPEMNRKILPVYAYVMNDRFNTVLDFLSNEPSPLGQESPLELVISKGFCGQYYSFCGGDRRSVEPALKKIFEHGLRNLSSPLHRIIFKEKSGETIPLLTKICNLMINDKLQRFRV